MKWISVKDRFPEPRHDGAIISEKVLIARGVNDKQIQFGWYRGYEEKEWVTSDMEPFKRQELITHWMPLPKQPIGKEKSESPLHTGTRLYHLNAPYCDTYGHFVYVQGGTVEDIYIFKGECRISIRWDDNSCQCVDIPYITSKIFLNKDEAINKLLAFEYE